MGDVMNDARPPVTVPSLGGVIETCTGIDWRTFLDEYWRRKPLHVPGAAAAVGNILIIGELRRGLDGLRRTRPDLWKRNEHGVTFGQNLDAAMPGIRTISRAIGSELLCANVWFDAVETTEGGGIGCHFDNSDNFSIQIEGTKRWRLGPPDVIPRDVRRLSMLRVPNVGGDLEMPGDATEFELQPGDMVYIPLLWLHEGESPGPGLSTTITCNSEPGLALLPYVRWALSEEEEWWSAVPLQRAAGARSAAEAAADLDSYFERLFSYLADKEVQARVRDGWLADRFEAEFALQSASAVSGSGAQR